MNLKHKFIIFVPYCDIYKEYILECLTSIENQNYINFEIIIVNDGGNLNILKKLTNGRNKYKILDFKENNGPAFSKWKFIEYIQNNLDKYCFNDICIIVDGDDYLLQNALDIINNTYLNNKCWCTFGDGIGKFMKQNKKYYNDSTDYSKIRNSNWFANHPRTMKLFLLLNLKITDFQFNNKWMKKATDRIMIYKIFELSGKNRISYINKNLYYYREHNLNSYKTFKGNKKDILDYCNSSEKLDEYIEDIHIVMCCWKRFQNLESQFEMLDNQTVSKRIHFHLVNNNYDEKEDLENKVEEYTKKYKNIKVSVSHYKNKYYGFQRFLYIKNVLLKKFILDYVIIIDDDQLYKNDWVEKMWQLRKPKIYTGWYCKKWNDNYSYWEGSILKIDDCKYNKKVGIVNMDCIGTGGCLIDTFIFNIDSPLWKIPDDLPKNVLIYNIEDLWLSFMAKHKLGYKLTRSFLPEYKCINKNNIKSHEVSLYLTIKREKKLLLNYLINKYLNSDINNSDINNSKYCLQELSYTTFPLIKIYCNKTKRLWFKDIKKCSRLVKNEYFYILYFINGKQKLLAGIAEIAEIAEIAIQKKVIIKKIIIKKL